MKKLLILLFLLTMNQEVFSQNDQQSGWLLYAHSRENYNPLTMANGMIGIVSSVDEPLHVSRIMLNGVYGRSKPNEVSRILEGINFANLDLYFDGEKLGWNQIKNWSQVLDMQKASFTTKFDLGDKATVTHTLYALRNAPYIGLITVTIEPKKDLRLKATNLMTIPEEYQQPENTFEKLVDLETTMPILESVAKSPLGRHTISATSVFIFEGKRPELQHQVVNDHTNTLSFSQTLKKGQTYQFSLAGAVCTTERFTDPRNESDRFAIFALLEGKDRLIEAHTRDWAKLWKHDILIDGDVQSQKDVHFALFNLYSFAREGTGLSIPPMGLSSTGYNGHIFWDMELWMYPPILLLQPQIARSILDYRFERLQQAKAKAANYGYKGAMFPWESDDTGEEATPTFALTGVFEHHITADVGIAYWNYYRVTQDKQWLAEVGYPMLKEVADFWVSRSAKNDDGSYSIRNVVGADEFAQNVDDNAFTNGSAVVALRYAAKAAQTLNKEADTQWKEVADHLRILQFDDGVTREYAGYDGVTVKQADANLLAYPLGLITDENRIRKDLDYYEPKMAKEGPAMAHAVLSILHGQLGDCEEAFRLFQRGYQPNQRPPFGVLSEAVTSNNPYFATAAGGMLQAVLFGFAGLELTDEGIVQKNTCLPKEWKGLKITGVGRQEKEYAVKP